MCYNYKTGIFVIKCRTLLLVMKILYSVNLFLVLNNQFNNIDSQSFTSVNKQKYYTYRKWQEVKRIKTKYTNNNTPYGRSLHPTQLP